MALRLSKACHFASLILLLWLSLQGCQCMALYVRRSTPEEPSHGIEPANRLCGLQLWQRLASSCPFIETAQPDLYVSHETCCTRNCGNVDMMMTCHAWLDFLLKHQGHSNFNVAFPKDPSTARKSKTSSSSSTSTLSDFYSAKMNAEYEKERNDDNTASISVEQKHSGIVPTRSAAFSTNGPLPRPSSNRSPVYSRTKRSSRRGLLPHLIVKRGVVPERSSAFTSQTAFAANYTTDFLRTVYRRQIDLPKQ